MKIVPLVAKINGSSAETPKEVAATLRHVFPNLNFRLADITPIPGDDFPIRWNAPVPNRAWRSARAWQGFADTAVVLERGGHESLFSIEFDNPEGDQS